MRHLDFERKPTSESIFRRDWRSSMFPDPSTSYPRGSLQAIWRFPQKCCRQIADSLSAGVRQCAVSSEPTVKMH